MNKALWESIIFSLTCLFFAAMSGGLVFAFMNAEQVKLQDANSALQTQNDVLRNSLIEKKAEVSKAKYVYDQALANISQKYNSSLELLKEQYAVSLDLWNYTTDPTVSLKTRRINGLYSASEHVYCVSTYARTKAEIASTEEHEKCHALVDRDYEHFCNAHY